MRVGGPVQHLESIRAHCVYCAGGARVSTTGADRGTFPGPNTKFDYPATNFQVEERDV